MDDIVNDLVKMRFDASVKKACVEIYTIHKEQLFYLIEYSEGVAFVTIKCITPLNIIFKKIDEVMAQYSIRYPFLIITQADSSFETHKGVRRIG